MWRDSRHSVLALGMLSALAALVANGFLLFAPILTTLVDGRVAEYSSLSSHFLHSWQTLVLLMLLAANCVAGLGVGAGAWRFQRRYVKGHILMQLALSLLILTCALIAIQVATLNLFYLFLYACSCLCAIVAERLASRESGAPHWFELLRLRAI